MDSVAWREHDDGFTRSMELRIHSPDPLRGMTPHGMQAGTHVGVDKHALIASPQDESLTNKLPSTPRPTLPPHCSTVIGPLLPRQLR